MMLMRLLSLAVTVVNVFLFDPKVCPVLLWSKKESSQMPTSLLFAVTLVNVLPETAVRIRPLPRFPLTVRVLNVLGEFTFTLAF